MPAELQDAERKLAELILYISAKCARDPHFGAVKLNKILFHADFGAYGEFGKAITGAHYIKLERGPGIREMLEVRAAMVENHDIMIQPELKYAGPERKPGPTSQARIIPLRDPDLSPFEAREIAYLDQVIEELRELSGAQLSKMTQERLVWCVARDLLDPIPYSAVFLSDEPPTDYERSHGLELAERYGWPI